MNGPSELRGTGAVSVAARRSVMVTGFGGLVAVGFGAVAAFFPMVIPAVILVPLVVLVPLIAVAIAVLADGIVFPLLLEGGGPTLVNIGVLVAVLVALPVALARRRVNPAVVRLVAAFGVMAVPGVVIAVLVFPSSQLLSGIRYFVVPLAVALLATTLSDRQLRALLKAVTLLMVVSLVAAIIETVLGSDALLKLTGLAYGTSIRNIGSALRAPGTFATNFHLGAYSAVVAVIALLWWGTLRGARRDILWRIVALVAALGCLALSTYRTGVILLVVGVIAAVFLGGDAVRRWVKVLVVAIAAGVVLGFLAIGLGASGSLFERLDIWQQLLGGPPAFLGHGIGYSGAASGAAGAVVQIFTDNYYISLWLQFGIPGIAVIGLFIGVFVALLRAGRRGNRRAAIAGCLWLGVLVAMTFVELWEYTSAMSLIAIVVGSSANGFRGSSSAIDTALPGARYPERQTYELR